MGKYCFLHKKIIKDKTIILLTNIQKQIKEENWNEFIAKLKANCERTTPDCISIKKFFKILDSYDSSMTKIERDDLVE